MKRIAIALLLLGLAGAAPPTASARRRAVGVRPAQPAKVTVTANARPQYITAHGRRHLVWELLLHNDRDEELTLRSIDVIAAGSNVTLASYADAALRPLLFNIPARIVAIPPAETVRAHEYALIYLWQTLDDVPSFVTHRIRFISRGVEETIHGPLTAVRLDPPVAIGTALEGSSWLAANGPANDSSHRRAVLEIDGKLVNAQRFAIDWIRIDARGLTFSGNSSDNASYYAYGRDLLAVAEALVSATRDGIPENVPRKTPVVAITLDTIAGNYVVLDLGGGAHAVYAHLQPGSLRVKVGDRVTRGAPLGKLGNSGNSTEPHLHFHVCDANASIACDGLPYALDHFTVGGASRQLEIPLKDEVCGFD